MSIFNIIKESFRFTRTLKHISFKLWLCFLAVAFFLSVAIRLSDNTYWLVFCIALMTLSQSRLAVFIHRVLIIKDNDKYYYSDAIFKTAIYYSLIVFIYYFCNALVLSATAHLTKITIFAGGAFLISAFFTSRFILILPSISVNKNLTFSESYNLTKNCKFPIFFVSWVCPLLIFLLIDFTDTMVDGVIRLIIKNDDFYNVFYYTVFDSFPYCIRFLIPDIITSYLWVFWASFEVSALSMIYNSVFEKNSFKKTQ